VMTIIEVERLVSPYRIISPFRFPRSGVHDDLSRSDLT
jgi:hypothetical protein